MQFIPLIADTGFHVVTFTGQDNGADSLESTVSIVLAVYYTPAPPPVITGDTMASEGQGVVLNAGSGYDDYIWTNGYFGPTVLVGPGSYMCLATSGNCRLASNEITIYGVPNPEPDITGQLFSCGGIPATLGTDRGLPPIPLVQWKYSRWHHGGHRFLLRHHDRCQWMLRQLGHGERGQHGKQAGSSIGSNSPSSVLPPSSVTYYDISTIDGSTIVSSSWYIDSVPVAGSD